MSYSACATDVLHKN